MLKTTKLFKPAFALAAMAGPVLAGMPVLTLGNPEASAQARAMHAVLTVKPGGCLVPGDTTVTGIATGIVGGERRSIPLKLERLPEAGLYAVVQQWPTEGRWVLQFTATNGTITASALVPAGPNGVDRDKATFLAREALPSDIDAVLNGRQAAVAKK